MVTFLEKKNGENSLLLGNFRGKFTFWGTVGKRGSATVRQLESHFSKNMVRSAVAPSKLEFGQENALFGYCSPLETLQLDSRSNQAQKMTNFSISRHLAV